MYEGKFTVGQTIRSYDFEGRKDCYVEGVIVACHTELTAERPYYAYELDVTREVFDGDEGSRHFEDENVFAPMATMFDYEGRLELVEDPKRETVQAGPMEDSPAAACKRCGGWTPEGGMSQHRETKRPVQGRFGCTCHGAGDEYRAHVTRAYKAVQSVLDTNSAMQKQIDRNRRQLELTENSVRGQNTLVCLTHEGSDRRSFLCKVPGGINFSAYAYNSPRFAPDHAARIVKELSESGEYDAACTFSAVFDRDAMLKEIAELEETIEWTRIEVLNYPPKMGSNVGAES